MKSQKGVFLGAGVILVLAAAAAGGQETADVPAHLSGELISSDPARRVVVVRNSYGGDADRVPVREAFARQVAMLSEDARPIDTLWASFVTACKVQPFDPGDGRPWFGLWDGRVVADYSTSSCRDTFNQVIVGGEVIKQGMAASEEVARRTLSAGDIREIRKAHVMDWDGWALPAPPRREP